MKQGWVPTIPPDQKTGPVPGAKPTARWKSFDNAEGGRTRVRTDLWRDADGNLASYTFWYLTRDAKSLSVDARYCTAAIFGKYRCVRHPPIPHDESLYSIAMKIKRIEPTGKDVKVFVGIENNGKKPVLLGLNGELSDGSPELWVLGVEQQGENKEWSSVDAVCPEHPPLDWVTLKPGERVDSWALAVDFPEPNHRFAKCSREISHLHGRIRTSIRYYTDTCEIEEVFDNPKPYFAVSEPVGLPEQHK